MNAKYRSMLRAFRALQHSPARRLAVRMAARNDRGDRIDPDTALILWFNSLEGDPDLDRRTEAEARASMEETCAALAPPDRDMQEVRSVTVADRPGRLYVPRRATEGRLLLYFHGGGWVVGSLASHHPVCQVLADEGRQRVLAVDYRLAPEHPFPAPVHDAVDAYRWARAHAHEIGADPTRIAVGGDSAGGNLAAVICQVQRDEGRPQPAFQLLIYPATDFRRITPAHLHLGDGYVLTRHSLDWYEARYLPETLNPRCSPLLADSLLDLAPAIIANAGFDPLRDDGERYGRALARAGVPVDMHDHPGLIHGFASMGGVVPAAAVALDGLAHACNRAYG